MDAFPSTRSTIFLGIKSTGVSGFGIFSDFFFGRPVEFWRFGGPDIFSKKSQDHQHADLRH
jgi:hypothetical protein